MNKQVYSGSGPQFLPVQSGNILSAVLPALDPATWTIADYELAYDGMNRMAMAGIAVTDQPRATDSNSMNFLPGAGLLDAFISGCLERYAVAITDHLKTIRFEERGDDDRRVRLLLRYEIDNPGMEVPALVQLALDQSVRPAAAA